MVLFFFLPPVLSILQEGTNPNRADDKGRAAIHFGVTKGHRGIGELLISHDELNIFVILFLYCLKMFQRKTENCFCHIIRRHKPKIISSLIYINTRIFVVNNLH